MKKLILILSVILYCSKLGFCSEVSLIDGEQINSQGNLVNKIDEEEDGPFNQEDLSGDQFQQMNDFINLENEKIKDIKLLNLDLQKADLQLKKKEIEQKINQISKGETISLVLKDDNDGVVSNIPSLKLVSVFVSNTDQKAVININGINRNVIQGQRLDSIEIKEIAHDKVLVELANGQIQELIFS